MHFLYIFIHFYIHSTYNNCKPFYLALVDNGLGKIRLRTRGDKDTPGTRSTPTPRVVLNITTIYSNSIIYSLSLFQNSYVKYHFFIAYLNT